MEKVKLIEIKKLFYSVVFWNVSANVDMTSFVQKKQSLFFKYILNKHCIIFTEFLFRNKI